MSNMLPLPNIIDYNKEYFDAVKHNKLKLQYCRDCKKTVFYPRNNCSSCLKTDTLVWKEASGEGELYSFAVVHRPQHEAFYDQVPIMLAAVKLKEGPVMISRVVDCDSELFIGMKLKVKGFKMSEEVYVPVFYPYSCKLS
jgi:uncharacterized OB-fold protein